MGLLPALRRVSLDQRVGELPLAAHELEAVPLEQCSAHAERPQLLPLADERSKSLLQLLDARPNVAAAEVEGALVDGERRCVFNNTGYPSSAAHAVESLRARAGPTRGRAGAANARVKRAILVTAPTQPSTKRDAA